jgi:hypothetical protein
MQRIAFIICGSLLLSNSVFGEENLTRFAHASSSDWQTKAFVGETLYNIVDKDNQTVLKATSHSTASGLIYKQKIDLQKTPYLNWQWLIENRLGPIDERSKSGDDYVARVYVVIDGGLALWKTKALTYVWSSNQSKGQVWDNAFAGDAVKMIAVRGKDAQTNTWYTEKRNVYRDLIAQFGDQGSEEANLKKYRYIDATVIMTDTDNAGGSATAYYSDMIFK